MTPYRLSGPARRDLLQIWNYIAENNIAAAQKVRRELRESMRRIGENPGIGHEREDVPLPGCLCLAVRSYVIVYAANTRPVTIARIIHGARDLGAIFRDS